MQFPESVEFELLPPDDYNLKKADSLPEYKLLEISIWSMDGLADKIADYQVFAGQWM